MRFPRRSGGSAPSGPTLFDERLSVPWWWWFPAAGAVLLVAFEVHLGHPGVPTWLPVAVVAPLAAWGLFRLGATRVTLVDESSGERSLRVGRARLPVDVITGVVRIAAQDKQRVLGPDLDPVAYLVHRPWVGPMLRVSLRDPADPTPYWLFSVRDPERLRRALDPAGDQDGDQAQSRQIG